MAVWVVRGGANNEREEWCLTNGYAGGGWDEWPDLSGCQTREEIAAVTSAVLQTGTTPKVANYAGQLFALRHRIEVGDTIVFPLKLAKGKIAIGICTGTYKFLTDEHEGRQHVIQVDWKRADIPRSAIKQDLLYSLGAFMTICRIQKNDAEYRIGKVLETGEDPGARAGEVDLQADTGDDAAESGSLEQADLVQAAQDKLMAYLQENFKSHGLSELVGAILTAKGFTVSVSSPGPDGGIDVVAGMGPLGLDSPRVVVQVKSESGAVGVDVVQRLQGAIGTTGADQALLVAWGGLTKPAESNLTHQQFKVRVWDAGLLIQELVQVYPALPAEIRARLPLTQVWTVNTTNG